MSTKINFKNKSFLYIQSVMYLAAWKENLWIGSSQPQWHDHKGLEPFPVYNKRSRTAGPRQEEQSYMYFLKKEYLCDKRHLEPLCEAKRYHNNKTSYCLLKK